jgi:hypothetical protein
LYGVGVFIPSEISTPEPPVSSTETVLPVQSFQEASDGCSYVVEVAEGEKLQIWRKPTSSKSNNNWRKLWPDWYGNNLKTVM